LKLIFLLDFFTIRFPVIDNDILTNDLKELIYTAPLVNTDILIGVTADESLYVAEEHMFHHYLPRKYRTNPSMNSTTVKSTEYEQSHGFSYFKKNKYIKNYLQTNHPSYLCFYEEIQARYMPRPIHQDNVTEIAHLYTNLVR